MVKSVEWILAVLLVLGASTPLRAHEEHGSEQEKSADYAHPLRDYSCRRVAGWSVLLEEEMLTNAPALTQRTLRRLETRLNEIRGVLPSHTLSLLQRVPIFVLYGNKSKYGGRSRGAQYFAQNAPDHNKSLDPRMASCIVIFSADHFVGLSDFGASKILLHEMAHAWHLEQWPENQVDIVSAYQGAMEKRLYRSVRKADGKVLEKAYATENHLEYFAEVSCTWLLGSDSFPFDRGDMSLYDPSGASLMRKFWDTNPKHVTEGFARK